MSKVLIVEDEVAIADLEKDYLELSGFEVEIETSGEIGLSRALSEEFDMFLLDLMLPGVDGFEICKKIREVKNTPILMVSAKKDDIDKIRGLGLGADDYITKSFNTEILMRRLEVALRRNHPPVKTLVDRYDDGFLCLDFGALIAIRNGEKLAITPNEYKILRLLTASPGNLVTRQILLLGILWEEIPPA